MSKQKRNGFFVFLGIKTKPFQKLTDLKQCFINGVSVPKGTLRHKAKALTKEEVEANRSSAYDYLDL